MEKTIIAWTDHTYNAWWGCAKISAGCKNCYAESLAARFGFPNLWGPDSDRRTFGDKHWRQPLEWNHDAIVEGRRRKVFCGSMMDWAEDHPIAEAIRPRIFETIRATPNLDWQLLTKRTERIEKCLPSDWGGGYPNVWLGTTIEGPDVACRADILRNIPAAVRFVSYEPAIGPLDDLSLSGIDWVIYGGESGKNYRDHNLDWPRAMRDKCRASGTAFFFKQSAAWRTEIGTTLDGETIREYPTPIALV